MKPIIIDMSEMTDSTEVYGSRPKPIVYWSLYLIFGIILAALLWMCLFKLDIVVKGMGTVAVSEDTSTVTNQLPGTVTQKVVQDGQTVQKGDILYVIEHQEYDLQLTTAQKLQEDNLSPSRSLSFLQS